MKINLITNKKELISSSRRKPAINILDNSKSYSIQYMNMLDDENLLLVAYTAPNWERHSNQNIYVYNIIDKTILPLEEIKISLLKKYCVGCIKNNKYNLVLKTRDNDIFLQPINVYNEEIVKDILTKLNIKPIDISDNISIARRREDIFDNIKIIENNIYLCCLKWIERKRIPLILKINLKNHKYSFFNLLLNEKDFDESPIIHIDKCFFVNNNYVISQTHPYRFIFFKKNKLLKSKE